MCKMFFYSVLFINLYLYLNLSPLFLDYAHNWEISFQDPASPIMEGIIALHHDIMFILSIIGFFVTWLLYITNNLYFHKNNFYYFYFSNFSKLI